MNSKSSSGIDCANPDSPTPFQMPTPPPVMTNYGKVMTEKAQNLQELIKARQAILNRADQD